MRKWHIRKCVELELFPEILLKKVTNQKNENKITFNITNQPEFHDVRKIGNAVSDESRSSALKLL